MPLRSVSSSVEQRPQPLKVTSPRRTAEMVSSGVELSMVSCSGASWEGREPWKRKLIIWTLSWTIPVGGGVGGGEERQRRKWKKWVELKGGLRESRRWGGRARVGRAGGGDGGEEGEEE